MNCLDSLQSAESNIPISQHFPFSPIEQTLGAAEALAKPFPSLQLCWEYLEATDQARQIHGGARPPPQPQKEQPHPSGRHRAGPQQVCFLFLDTEKEGHLSLTRVNPDFGSCYWIGKSWCSWCRVPNPILICCSTLEQLPALYIGAHGLGSSAACPEKAEIISIMLLLWSFLILISFVTPTDLAHRLSSFYKHIKIPFGVQAQIWVTWVKPG